MIEPIQENLWQIPYESKTMGVQFLNKTTIVRIGEDLLTISPGPWEDTLGAELSKLGRLRWIIAPNAFHHFHFRAWQRANPEAEAWGTQALATKRPNIRFDHLWHGQQPFQPDVQVFGLAGIPKVDELLFYHAPSKTLLVTDLIFNEHRLSGLGNWFFYTLFGVWKTTGTSRLFKSVITDKAAFRESLAPVLTLEIERVVCAHGETLTDRQQFTKALSWV